MEKEMTLNEGTVTVVYDYLPEEKETRDSPYYGADVDIEKILFEGVNIYDVVDPNDYDDLSERLYDYHADESNFIDL